MDSLEGQGGYAKLQSAFTFKRGFSRIATSGLMVFLWIHFLFFRLTQGLRLSGVGWQQLGVSAGPLQFKGAYSRQDLSCCLPLSHPCVQHALGCLRPWGLRAK